MLFKNVASQKIHVYAYDSTTGAAKTGDAANITGYVSLDGTANAIDDTNPAEVDSTNMPGLYVFDLTQAETNCNAFALVAKSSTANIRIEPIIGFTTGAAITQTGDAFARLGAPAGASVSADVAAVKAETASILEDTGTTLDTLIRDIPTNAEFEARTLPAADYVVVTDTLARVTLVDTCTTNTDMRGTNSAALASVCTEGRLAELDALNLPADVAAVKIDSAAIKAKTDNLPASPANEATLTTIAGYLDTEIAAILADTNELQTDWANGGRLDLILDSAIAPTASAVADAVWDEALSGHSGAGSAGLALSTASSGGVDPSVLADAIWDEALSGHSTAGTAGKKLTDLTNADLSGVATAAALTTVDGIVDAIKAKTDNIPASPATEAKQDTIIGYIDTEVAAIKAVTDKLDTAVELDGAVYRLTENALEQAPTGGGSLTVEDIVDGVLDEMLSAHAEVGSVGAGIAAAGSAGDPWSTALPGAYEEGTAGYLIGNNMPSAGSGSTPWPYRLTDAATGQPIAGAAVRVSTDAAGTITVASGTTDANGYATFNIDPGTYYIWRTCAGFLFNNPDTEVVS